jgi:hypothetical protein
MAIAVALPLAPALPGHALMGPSTARGLSGSIRCFIGLDALDGAPLVKNRPGDAGELVGERNRQHVVGDASSLAYATPFCLNQASIRAQASLAASAR